MADKKKSSKGENPGSLLWAVLVIATVLNRLPMLIPLE